MMAVSTLAGADTEGSPPERGQSLFDDLFLEEEGCRLPFPFDRPVERIDITWPGSASSGDPFGEQREREGAGVLRRVQPSGLMDRALDRLVKKNLHGESDLLAALPFRGQRLLKALVREISDMPAKTL